MRGVRNREAPATTGTIVDTTLPRASEDRTLRYDPSNSPATRATLAAAPSHQRETVHQLAPGLADSGHADAQVAAAVARWTTSPVTSDTDPLADHRRGMEAVLRCGVVAGWWTAPDDRDFPPLRVEREMAEAAAALLSAGERPWRVVRSLERTWPEWRGLLPELVRVVVEIIGTDGLPRGTHGPA